MRLRATCLAQFTTAAAQATAIAILTSCGTISLHAFGVAYRLTNRTVIRGGAGIFNSNYINQGLGLPAFGYSTTASFSSADSGTTPAFNWDNGFPQNFRRPPVIDPTAANRQGVTAVLPDQYRLPYKMQWNFLVEHQFASDLSMSFAYVANAGRHLYAPQNINQCRKPMRPCPLSLLTSRVDSPAAQAAGYREPFPGFTCIVGSSGNGRAGAASISAVCRRYDLRIDIRQFELSVIPVQARQAVCTRSDRHCRLYVVEIPHGCGDVR